MTDRTSPEPERLAQILMRCRTVLSNMAEENEGAIFNRWPINHEPLRADAKNLVPLIDEALAEYHKAWLKTLNDYHDHHPLGLAQTGQQPVAWQFRQRSAVGKGPQSSLPWCDWVCIEREDYERYIREPNNLVQVRPLYERHAQTPAVATPEMMKAAYATYENDAILHHADDWLAAVVNAALSHSSTIQNTKGD